MKSMLRNCLRELRNHQTRRTIKTLHTPIYRTKNLHVLRDMLSGIKLLDKIINSSSYNKTLIHEPKYKSRAQVVSSQDTVRLNSVIRELLDSLQMDETTNTKLQSNKPRKLGRVGLQLFMDCSPDILTSTSTSLTSFLLEQYLKYPEEEVVNGILIGLKHIRDFLEKKKIMVKGQSEIDALVDQFAISSLDGRSVKKVLQAINYELFSDDVVRVVNGNKTDDEIDVSKGWKYPAGILDSNEAYLRSLELPKKKLVSIDREMLVLMYDGTLRDANKILPTITYARNLKKSVLLIVNGDCTGDALTSITINNNRNKRENNESRTVIMKYSGKANDNLALQENYDFIKFLRLPCGYDSIYSPEYSQLVPSKMCANKYYGSVGSIKATTGEAFLYNKIDFQATPTNKASKSFLRKTVTLSVGGRNEIEIDQRRNTLDNFLNNTLCHGLAEGFVPGYGVSLLKTIPGLNKLRANESDFMTKLGMNAVLSAVVLPSQVAFSNAYGYNHYEISNLIADAINENSFQMVKFSPNSGPVDTVKSGSLEPWSKMDSSLAGIGTFIKLLTSCNIIVTCIYEKPDRRTT
ncbi:TCM62-like protein [Saccharomyces kudriavzevii IFO 1802]|uniref:TCM62-like protein n=2 Tax=Saccharomyces kudriavzevii (strain ATCC MYA-4449 / AS 2.2408 / CBS 8840 / NBRC 1802 / NCYC 2889) TaxID=226230 RepID=J4TV74_SACK1|nr:TCM62-like protein [Saccharomyces kudriavzevii IFO 1802]